MKRRAHLVLIPLVLTASACGDAGETYQPPPTDLTTAGTYQLVSPVDLTASALLPDPVHSYLQVLKDLRTDPANTLFVVLDEAGVPLVGTLVGALPAVLEDRLKGAINDYVFGASFQGAPVTGELDALLAQASSVLTRFDLATQLELPAPDVDGRSTAVHHLRELHYALWGGQIPVVVSFDLLDINPAGTLFVREASLPARVAAGQAGADAQLTLGDHAFGIPYGRYAFSALNLGSQQRYGIDLRGALGLLFNCPALAASVSQRCVLGACVGHAPELTGICEQGLDQVVANLRARIEALNFDALRLQRGDAALWDTPATAAATRDKLVDRLADGVWKATIDIGMGPRPVPATFAGTRLR